MFSHQIKWLHFPSCNKKPQRYCQVACINIMKLSGLIFWLPCAGGIVESTHLSACAAGAVTTMRSKGSCSDLNVHTRENKGVCVNEYLDMRSLRSASTRIVDRRIVMTLRRSHNNH